MTGHSWRMLVTHRQRLRRFLEPACLDRRRGLSDLVCSSNWRGVTSGSGWLTCSQGMPICLQIHSRSSWIIFTWEFLAPKCTVSTPRFGHNQGSQRLGHFIAKRRAIAERARRVIDNLISKVFIFYDVCRDLEGNNSDWKVEEEWTRSRSSWDSLHIEEGRKSVRSWRETNLETLLYSLLVTFFE